MRARLLRVAETASAQFTAWTTQLQTDIQLSRELLQSAATVCEAVRSLSVFCVSLLLTVCLSVCL